MEFWQWCIVGIAAVTVGPLIICILLLLIGVLSLFFFELVDWVKDKFRRG